MTTSKVCAAQSERFWGSSAAHGYHESTSSISSPHFVRESSPLRVLSMYVALPCQYRVSC